MGIFRYPLVASRSLATLLSDVDPSRRLHVAARDVFRDVAGYTAAEARGVSPDEYAFLLHQRTR